MSGADEFLRCKGRKRIGHAREVLDAEHTVLRKGPPHRVLRLSAWWLEGWKGTRRRRRRRAEHETPPPSGDGGTRLSVWSLPLPARPLATVRQSPGPGLLGRGRSLWCVRCCWPSNCSPVGHGIKALRGRLRRGSFRAPGALAWIRPLRPFGRFAALTPRPCRSGWRLRSGLQRGRSVQRIQHSGGGFYVGVG